MKSLTNSSFVTLLVSLLQIIITKMASENPWQAETQEEMEPSTEPVISFTDIACAAFQVRKYVIRTPLTVSKIFELNFFTNSRN